MGHGVGRRVDRGRLFFHSRHPGGVCAAPAPCAIQRDRLASAQQALHDESPDVLLLDIQLPGVDGLSFVVELKADARWQAVPVVAFTAYAMKGDEQKMRTAGCDGYIGKPIDVSQFAQQVLGFLPG